MASVAAPQIDLSRQMRNPQLVEAAIAMNENRLHDAEPILRAHLKADPFDVAAMRMLAELAGRIGRLPDAEKLLRRAVELAPNFLAARSNLALVLYRQNRPTEAVAELDELLAVDPDNIGNTNLKAAALGRTGEYQEALELYEKVLEAQPHQPKVWMSLGHVLKTIGRQADGLEAYRRALTINPALGEVWWSLANLKTVTLSDQDINAMTVALATPMLSEEDQLHLHFALGKALEDEAEIESAFRHYKLGNAIRREHLRYDAEETTRQTNRAIATFTPEFLAARANQGDASPDPIFIVGMPRAGSTLLEQILASHSLVEGTHELPDIPALAARVSSRKGGIASWSAEELRELGLEYLKRTSIQRKTGKPYFIDKLPNNWAHAGLIHLILPNAKIIDARRHPLGCCFSNFKQHFARGQSFTYGLEDLGRYYADYVRLMEHFDRVLPGRIHRVIYERMVDDTEGQVRSLLEALGFPFEESCLRFYENDRAVRTASSEQVRQPIYRQGTEQWMRFEKWLDPLATALGPVLACYPQVPDFNRA